jgi:hypothetical protein
MKFFTQLFIFLTLLLFHVGCSDSKPEKLLVSLEDDLQTSVLDTKREVSVHVYAHFDDNSKQEVTEQLIWRSSDPTIAKVDQGTITTFEKEGFVDISYETQESSTDGTPLFFKKLQLNVKDIQLLSIEILPNNLILYEDQSSQLKALGSFDNNTTLDITQDCNWSSLNPEVATVLPNGLLYAKLEGSSTIYAKSSGIESFINLTVRHLAYDSIAIDTIQTTFNVEQNITLKVYAMQENNTTRIELPNDQLNFYTSDSSVISLQTDTLIAQSKGSAQITAELKSDNNIRTSTTFTVEKENYLRIFKNGIELSFPYAQTQECDSFPQDQFDSFTLRAVGRDFHISSLLVSDFSGNIYPSNVAWFDGLEDGDTIVMGQNKEYKLKHNNTKREILYYFKIDDEFNNTFSQKYKALN